MRSILITALALLGLLAPAAAETVDCSNPACAAKLSPTCLKRVGAGALAAGDVCRAEQDAYLSCITAVAQTCAAAPRAEAGACTPEDARQLYAELKNSRDIDALKAFAEDCKGSPQARQAALRVEKLDSARSPASTKPAQPKPASSPTPTSAPAAKSTSDPRRAEFESFLGTWALMLSNAPVCDEGFKTKWTADGVRLYVRKQEGGRYRDTGPLDRRAGDMLSSSTSGYATWPASKTSDDAYLRAPSGPACRYYLVGRH